VHEYETVKQENAQNSQTAHYLELIPDHESDSYTCRYENQYYVTRCLATSSTDAGRDGSSSGHLEDSCCTSCVTLRDAGVESDDGYLKPVILDTQYPLNARAPYTPKRRRPTQREDRRSI
jgi:hypothetical protein